MRAEGAGFAAFIEWLDAGVPSDGQSYVEMHRRLHAYFARKGCTAADDLADETLTRAARRLAEEGTITGVSPAQFCYITARYVLLEHLRSPDRGHAMLPREVRGPSVPPDGGARERDLTSLEQCLGELEPRDRDLILSYYAGDRASRIAARRDLAARLGLSANALMVRASRLRDRLRERFLGSAPKH
jgi:DNA-directed RNA polymerase specialized sigma24 family protein